MAELLNPLSQRLTGQNLLKEVRPEHIPLPKSFWKLILLEVLSVLLAIAASFTFSEVLDGKAPMVIVALVLFAFFSVSFIRTVTEPGTGRRAILVLFETLGFLSFFLGTDFKYLAWAALVLFICNISADTAARRMHDNSLQFHFMTISRAKIGRTFTGLLLAALIIYLPQWNSAETLISRDRFKAFFVPAAETANTIVPSIDLRTTVGELARKNVRSQLERDESFAKLPPDVQDKEINAAVNVMLNEAAAQLGISLRSDMQIEEAFYVYTNNMVNGWRSSFGGAFELFWLIILFVLLRGIGSIFVWMALLFSFLVYEVLSALGFVAVLGETRTKEHVVLT